MQKSLTRHKVKEKETVVDTDTAGDQPVITATTVTSPDSPISPVPTPEPEPAPSPIANNAQSSVPLPTPTSASTTTTTTTVMAMAEVKKNNNNQITDVDTDLSYDYDKNYSESGSSTSLELETKTDLKTNEKCEKLEAFINNMMRKAEMLNTTREEQIQKKQQILEELQKVERELQEKAQAQLLLNVQHRLEQQQQQTIQQQSQGAKKIPQQQVATPQSPPKQASLLPQEPPSPQSPMPAVTVGEVAVTVNVATSPHEATQLEGINSCLVQGSEAVLCGPGVSNGEFVSLNQVTTSPNHITTSPSQTITTQTTPPHLREKKKAKRSIKPFLNMDARNANEINPTLPLAKMIPQAPKATMESLVEGEPSISPQGSPAKQAKPSPQNGVEPSIEELTRGSGNGQEDNRSSRASSEEVDLSNVIPATEVQQQQQQQLLVQSQQLTQLQQQQLQQQLQLQLQQPHVSKMKIAKGELTIRIITDNKIVACLSQCLHATPYPTTLVHS